MLKRWLSCLLVVAAAAVTTPALAEPRGGTVSLEDQKKAQEHFQRARELYLGGSYVEAITELEVARKLDPKAKDLVMNLGILHEKLGKYDESIGYLRSYLDMEGVTPPERAKVETMIKRVEGAKQRDLAAKAAQAKATPPPPPPPPRKDGPPEMGRIDALTITSASLTVAGVGVGAVFGVLALTGKPDDSFVTGRDGTYQGLQDDVDSAHGKALVSDVAFGVAAVALVATAFLYFGRTKDPTRVSSVSRTVLLGTHF